MEKRSEPKQLREFTDDHKEVTGARNATVVLLLSRKRNAVHRHKNVEKQDAPVAQPLSIYRTVS